MKQAAAVCLTAAGPYLHRVQLAALAAATHEQDRGVSLIACQAVRKLYEALICLLHTACILQPGSALGCWSAWLHAWQVLTHLVLDGVVYAHVCARQPGMQGLHSLMQRVSRILVGAEDTAVSVDRSQAELAHRAQ